mmetsp:Transcript_51917/g.149686  ORF Transcript_51917/g.149686 Transcript_51917/m.149686 type:complete len:706 (-) Transcript_51917:134-2251(-)
MSSARKPKGTSSRGTTSARSGTSSARGTSSSGGGSKSTSPKASSSSARAAGPSRSKEPEKSSKSSSKQSQASLMECVQKRFEKDVFGSAAGADAGWKILIVDEMSMKVLSAAVGMYDIMERKITLVESLEKKRAPFKDMGAIYVLSPSKDSVNRLVEDFADKNKVLYGPNIFVYFLGPLAPQQLNQIKQCKQLIKRLKALSEINVDFLVKEKRAFLVDVPVPFSGYFLRTGSGPAEVPIADKLVTVCATLNEYPYIRYKQTSGICKSVATLFKMKMDEFVSKNPSWWYHGSGNSGNSSQERERSTVLLLDRSNDCLTPLMHDFTYQSMVHDLLKMEGDKITYKAEGAEDPSKTEDKDVLLNEKDKLWVELRGKHIAQVIEILSGRIKEICKSNTSSAFSGGGDGNMSLSQLASALKALPEYREVMSKLSQHMHISHECMDEFNRNQLMDLSEIEQTLATGTDDEGRSPKLTEMISRVEGALLRMRDVKDRLRLVLIATISQNGLSSADRDRLLRAAQLGRDELLVLDSISKLGIQTLNNMGDSRGGGAMSFFGNKSKIQRASSFDEESEYASSRYVPALKNILSELVTNSLSIEEYPSVIPMPASMTSAASAGSARRRGKGLEGSARKKKGATDKWSRTGNSQTSSGAATSFQGGRNLVFMVGGISYNELKAARDVMDKESKEIIVGSTKFVSPSEFIDDLTTLT